MTVQEFFIVWQDIGLFLYAILKAFLPLPSLEVILVPLCLANMDKWIIYSLEGAAGTFIGGAIGYWIAYKAGRNALVHLAGKKDVEEGERLMNKYGLLAVFIGGITPIPDFLLAYLAGFTHMRFLSFALCDAVARLLRSLLVTYVLRALGTVMNVDAYGTVFSMLIIIWLLWKWWKNKRELTKEYS
ncbi:MAG: DedA family protein [Erysipelotrichaceae bacterium]|jgi:membrane protein YqaA with SNARE-associated domain|nr:DedA family protein [Erysipelotrichaceae bacterium]